MQVHFRLLAFAAILVVSTESKPTWSYSYLNAYNYPSEAIGVVPQLLRYQSSPYYLYNVQTELNTIPAAIIAGEKSTLHQLPTFGFYHGFPVYEFRFPLSPGFPHLKPERPQEAPKATPPPMTTGKPMAENGEGIEKLDTKTEAEEETEEPEETMESDDNDNNGAVDDSI